jgi:hypothetical protein
MQSHRLQIPDRGGSAGTSFFFRLHPVESCTLDFDNGRCQSLLLFDLLLAACRTDDKLHLCLFTELTQLTSAYLSSQSYHLAH